MTKQQSIARPIIVAAALAAALATAPSLAQRTLDRVDPTRVEATVPPPVSAVADAPPVVAAAPPTRAVDGAPVTVGAVVLSGLKVLPPSAFADIFGTYAGRTLSPPALAGLTDAIAARMRDRGYVLATARIPPQSVTAGILRVEVDEGSVDAVRIRGTTNRAAEAALAPLVGAGPVTLAQLERRLLLAGDIDGLWVRRSRLLHEGDRNVLEVDLGVDRFVADLGIDNYGSRPIGPIQADVTLGVRQLLASDDRFTLTGLLTPFEPSEIGFLRGAYAKRVSHEGTELSGSLSVARTRPGSYLVERDIAGSSWAARLDLLHPLVRRRTESVWLSASLGMRTVRQERADVLARRDRLTVARVGASGFAKVAGGRLRGNILLSRGLDLFDATAAGDPLASRSDADGVFTSLGLNASWTSPVITDVSTSIAVATQLADRPLLVSEEVGLGGGDFLRGYDYSERSGDRGAMMSGELRWAVSPRVGPVSDPLFYGFVDGGRVTNLRGGFGSGTLFSTGGGIRAQIGTIVQADLGVAVPLSGERYDAGNAAPVVNFRLARRF